MNAIPMKPLSDSENLDYAIRAGVVQGTRTSMRIQDLNGERIVEILNDRRLDCDDRLTPDEFNARWGAIGALFDDF